MQTETVWADFSRPLLGFINSRVADPDLAQDILQDIFVKIHLNLHTLFDTDKLAGWVYQITRHTLLDYLRSRKIATDLTDEEVTELADNPSVVHALSTCVRPFIDRLWRSHTEPRCC